MKTTRTLMILAIAVLSSMSLYAQDYTYKILSRDGYRYEGEWPAGDGVLYSLEDGLVIGTFRKGKPHGKCVCYKPNGEVYWGEFKNGKASGSGALYRDNGIVVSGGYKNGLYHGVDTLYRSNGTMHVGQYRNGKLIKRVSDTKELRGIVSAKKPQYPQVDLRSRQEDFLRELELLWEDRNIMLARKAGLVHPKFQGGNLDDFALWVNSQVVYPISGRTGLISDRTVIVEFTVMRDGTVSDVHAIFGSDPMLNEAAVKAVSKSPKWTPGEQNGVKRNVRMNVPVVFTM